MSALSEYQVKPWEPRNRYWPALVAIAARSGAMLRWDPARHVGVAVGWFARFTFVGDLMREDALGFGWHGLHRKLEQHRGSVR